MAARIAFARANVECGGVEYRGVQVLVHNNVARLTRLGEEVATLSGITEVARESRSRWRVEAPEATWYVERRGGG